MDRPSRGWSPVGIAAMLSAPEAVACWIEVKPVGMQWLPAQFRSGHAKAGRSAGWWWRHTA